MLLTDLVISIFSFLHLFCVAIHSIRCLSTTSPQPLPKIVLQGLSSIALSFKFQYLQFSLNSTNSLRLLPRLLVPSIFPSIACFRSQFLHKMRPIQLTFLHFTVCRIFLCSLTVCNTSSFLTRSSPAFYSTTFQNFPVLSYLLYKMSKFQHITQLCSKHFSSFFLKFSPI